MLYGFEKKKINKFDQRKLDIFEGSTALIKKRSTDLNEDNLTTSIRECSTGLSQKRSTSLINERSKYLKYLISTKDQMKKAFVSECSTDLSQKRLTSLIKESSTICR